MTVERICVREVDLAEGEEPQRRSEQITGRR